MAVKDILLADTNGIVSAGERFDHWSYLRPERRNPSTRPPAFANDLINQLKRLFLQSKVDTPRQQCLKLPPPQDMPHDKETNNKHDKRRQQSKAQCRTAQTHPHHNHNAIYQQSQQRKHQKNERKEQNTAQGIHIYSPTSSMSSFFHLHRFGRCILLRLMLNSISQTPATVVIYCGNHVCLVLYCSPLGQGGNIRG